MNDDFGGLRSRLAELADAPAPASPFDAARVAAAGRRRRTAARISGIGAGGALAVAVVLGVAAAFGPDADTDPGPVAAAAPGSGSDPLVAVVDYGWLPANLSNVSYVSAPDDLGKDVIAQADRSPNGEPRLDLKVLSGDGPGTPTADERMISVTLNDGRQAVWVTQSQRGGQFAGDFQLRFPTKSGRWASVTSSTNWITVPGTVSVTVSTGTVRSPENSSDGAPPTTVPATDDWQRTVLRVATEVTDTPKQLPMPLSVTGLPSDVQPSQVLLWRPGHFGDNAPGTWSVLLSFGSAEAEMTIEVAPHGTILKADPKACKTSAGLDACVEEAGKSPALKALGGVKNLLKRVTLYGMDERKWTTDVVVP